MNCCVLNKLLSSKRHMGDGVAADPAQAPQGQTETYALHALSTYQQHQNCNTCNYKSAGFSWHGPARHEAGGNQSGCTASASRSRSPPTPPPRRQYFIYCVGGIVNDRRYTGSNAAWPVLRCVTCHSQYLQHSRWSIDVLEEVLVLILICLHWQCSLTVASYLAGQGALFVSSVA